jgi:tetratricopeptide (TPR) repeat protein
MSGASHLTEMELPANPDHPEWPRWSTVRDHFGIRSFGVNAWTASEAGGRLIDEHDELGPRAGGHEELYFVARGHAVFTVNEEEVDAPTGTFVFVRDRAAKRSAVAKEPETTVLVAGGKRGEAFEISPWERSAPAMAYWGTGEFEKAIAIIAGAHAEYPDDPGVLYNLACAESRAGRRDEALDHLRETVELDGSFGELAESDEDFDPIRDDPQFVSAVAGQAKAAGSGS